VEQKTLRRIFLSSSERERGGGRCKEECGEKRRICVTPLLDKGKLGRSPKAGREVKNSVPETRFIQPPTSDSEAREWALPVRIKGESRRVFP